MATVAPPYYGMRNESETIDTSKSTIVKELQKDLLHLGYWINRKRDKTKRHVMTAKQSTAIDGIYGQNTTKAVKNLQCDYDLARKDGVVDFKTGEILKRCLKTQGLESSSSSLGGRLEKFLAVGREIANRIEVLGTDVNVFQLPPSSFYGAKNWFSGTDNDKYTGTPEEFEIVSNWGQNHLIQVIKAIALQWKHKGTLSIGHMSLLTGGSLYEGQGEYDSLRGDYNHLFGLAVDIHSDLYCDISKPNFDRFAALELAKLSIDLGAKHLVCNCNFVYHMLAGDPDYKERVAVSRSHHSSFHLDVALHPQLPWPLELDHVCEGCHPDRYQLCVHFRGRIEKTVLVAEGGDVEETASANSVSKEGLLLANPHVRHTLVEGKETFASSGRIVIPSDLSFFRQSIKKGDKGKIVEELQIRLAGFRGCIPDADFGEATKKSVIQFQEDVMGRTGTDADGIVDLATMGAIDKLGKDFPISFTELECPSCTCPGFGQERYKGKMFDTVKIKTFQKEKLGCSDSTATGHLGTKITYNGVKKTTRAWMCDIDKEQYPQAYQKDMPDMAHEAYHHFEYPGMHRSLLWAVRGIMFYLKKHYQQDHLSVGAISSGYRCWENNRRNERSSTNHMGKAIDLHIYKDGIRPTRKGDQKAECDKVRDLVVAKMRGQIRWGESNRLLLEPGDNPIYTNEFLAPTWVHMDVRMFNRASYLKEAFFCKNADQLDGKPLMIIKQQLGIGENPLDHPLVQKVLHKSGNLSDSLKDKLNKLVTAELILKKDTREAHKDVASAIQRALIYMSYPTASRGGYLIDGDWGSGSNKGFAMFLREHAESYLLNENGNKVDDQTLIFEADGPASSGEGTVNFIDVPLKSGGFKCLLKAIVATEQNKKVYGANVETAVQNLNDLENKVFLSVKKLIETEPYKSAIDATVDYAKSKGFNIYAPWIVAIVRVESGGRPNLRFEHHWLYKHYTRAEYPDVAQINNGKLINMRECRFRSTSFGIPQVMGFNQNLISFVSKAEEMYYLPLEGQFKMIIDYLLADREKTKIVLETDVASEEDVRPLAKFYNGKNYDKQKDSNGNPQPGYHQLIYKAFTEAKAIWDARLNGNNASA